MAALSRSGRIPLASGAYTSPSEGLPDKLGENAFLEKSRTLADGELQNVTRPGTLKQPDWATTLRGVNQADGSLGGDILAVAGNTLYRRNTTTGVVTAVTGAIAGTDKVRFAFRERDPSSYDGRRSCAILANGKPYFTDGTTIRLGTDGLVSTPGLVIGSTTTNVAYGDFDYSIAGVIYSKTGDAVGIAPGTDVIPLGLFGAVAFDIDAAGTITAVPAPANATGYVSVSDAFFALPDQAIDKVRMGGVFVTKSDGAFTFGTTAFSASNVTTTYSDADLRPDYEALLEDHEQTGFIDITAIGQRFVLLYGSRFAFTPPLQNSITAIDYYTAEYSPDGLVGGWVLGERLYLFGSKTIEPWEETGNSDDPLRRSLGLVDQVGCRARGSIIDLDDTLYWVDQNNQVRRLGSAQTPDTLSGPDVSDLLEATDPADMLAFKIEIKGHAFLGLHLPTGCPLFDANYGNWLRFRTNLTDSWRYGYALRVDGRLYVSDADGAGFAIMDKAYKSDHMPDANTMGTEIVVRISGYILTDRPRRLGPLRFEGSKGIGLANGQGIDPQIQMRRSLKGPNLFTAFRSRSIGKQGEYGVRVIWNQMGEIFPPGCAIELTWSDPVGPIITSLIED